MTEPRRPPVTPVTVLPAGIHLDVGTGETLFAAARRAGYHWPTVCGGQGTCTRCACHVSTCADNVQAPGARENAALSRMPPQSLFADGGPVGELRLACQLRFRGGEPVSVHKPGVRPRGGPGGRPPGPLPGWI